MTEGASYFILGSFNVLMMREVYKLRENRRYPIAGKEEKEKSKQSKQMKEKNQKKEGKYSMIYARNDTFDLLCSPITYLSIFFPFHSFPSTSTGRPHFRLPPFYALGTADTASYPALCCADGPSFGRLPPARFSPETTQTTAC